MRNLLLLSLVAALALVTPLTTGRCPRASERPRGGVPTVEGQECDSYTPCIHCGLPELPHNGSKVILYLVGLEALSARTDAHSCAIGIVNYAVGHRIRIWVEKKATPDKNWKTLNYEDYVCCEYPVQDFYLDFHDRPFTDGGIKFYRPYGTGKFPRESDQNDCNDFGWAVDFEGDDVLGMPAEVDEAFGLECTLQINGFDRATVFTPDCFLSSNVLRVRVNGGGLQPFGSVADGIGVEIPLKKEAIYISPKGNVVNLLPQDNESYLIVVANVPVVANAPKEVDRKKDEMGSQNDSRFYEHLIKGASGACKRVSFEPYGGIKPAETCAKNPVSDHVLGLVNGQGKFVPNAVCFTAAATKTAFKGAK